MGEQLGLAIAILLGIAACTPNSLHQRGMLELKRGDPDAAIELLEEASQADPDNSLLMRDLGIAYFRAQRFEEAAALLSRSLESRPADGRTLFHLGASWEHLQQTAKAIEAYQRFTQLSSFPLLGDSFRGKVESRLRLLLDRQLEADVGRQLALERTGDLGPPDDRTLAVLPISCLASDPQAPSDPRDAALAAALGDWMTTDLAKLRDRRLVERARLDALLRELALTRSDAFDEATRPRVGRLLGAGALIGGTLTTLSDGQVLARLAVYDVTTGGREAGYTAQRPLSEFFAFEKDLVFGVIESMGLPLSDLERHEIATHVPTRDLNAFLAYGRGLLAERRGEVEEARLAYQDALDHDDSFGVALAALQDLSAQHIDPQVLAAELDAYTVPADGAESDFTVGPDTDDRLEETDDLTGGDFWPEDPRETRPWDQGTEIPDPPELPEREAP